jgi:plasmid stabilization system protein ParE
MTTDRKIQSNRKNAQRSTGPRSEPGRQISRRNALRHGLAIAIGSDSSFSSEVETLASALDRRTGRGTVRVFARQLAEAEIDLLRIRKIRATQFGAIVDNPGAGREAHSELNENLAKLERYERRAYSRRKRALNAMMADQD